MRYAKFKLTPTLFGVPILAFAAGELITLNARYGLFAQTVPYVYILLKEMQASISMTDNSTTRIEPITIYIFNESLTVAS